MNTVGLEREFAFFTYSLNNAATYSCFALETVKGPFTLAIFAAILAAILAAISSAISRRFQNARVNYWRFKSPRNRQ